MCPFYSHVLAWVHSRAIPSATIDDINSWLAYRDQLLTLRVRPRGTGLAVATALFTDIVASRRVARPASTNTSHCLVKTPITLKQWHYPSVPHRIWDTSDFQNWFGAFGRGGFLLARVASRLVRED